MITTALVREFERVRQELCRAGIPVHVPWSLSVSDGASMVITCAAPQIPLTFDGVVETRLQYTDGRAVCASKDIAFHRAMYARGRHRAVLVCRPPYAMTLASLQPELAIAGRKVPVIAPKTLADLKRTFVGDEIALLKGESAIAGSVDAAACLDAMVSLENACRGALPGLSRA